MVSPSSIPQLHLHKPLEDLQNQGVFSYGLFEDNIQEAPNRTALHRHNFHEIFIFSEGSGIYSSDFQDHPIEAPCAVIVRAGICHQWKNIQQLKGVILGVDLEFLGLSSRTDGTISILRPSGPHVFPLHQKNLTGLSSHIQRIEREWQNHLVNRQTAIRASLTLILIDLLRCFESQQPTNPNDSASARLYSDFLELLDQTWKTSPRPKDLAEVLRVSPDYLSATLREVSGSNTSDLISERIVLEAKRLLAHSRMGIAEVAYSIGFEDPSYFARFFKRKSGLTPKEFRKQFEN